MASLISLPLSFLRRISRMRIPGLARGIVAPSLPATGHAQPAQDNEKSVRFTRTPTRGLRISGHLAIAAAGCLAMQGALAHSSSSLTDHHDSAVAASSQPYGFDDALPTTDDSGGWGWGVRAKGTIIKDHWSGKGLDSIYAKGGALTASTGSNRSTATAPTGFNVAKSFSRCVWDSASASGANKKDKISRFYISSPRPNGSDPAIGAQFNWNPTGGGNGQFEGHFVFATTSEMDLAFRLDDGHAWAEDDKIVLRCYRDVPSSWVLAIMLEVGERLEGPSINKVEFAHTGDAANNFSTTVDIVYPGDDKRGVGIGDGDWKTVTGAGAPDFEHQDTKYIKGLKGYSLDDNDDKKAVLQYYRNSPPGLYSVYTAFHDHNQGAIDGATTFTITAVDDDGKLTVTNSGIDVGGSDHPITEQSTFYSLVTLDIHPSNHYSEFHKNPADRTDTDIQGSVWTKLDRERVKVANVEGALVNATKKGIYVDNIRYEQGTYD
ncbi:MAG: hypothetical protein ISN26_05805, partial [Betaproteobacteria bacterium AqS2]|nr:hypothetical protein [Betaproteobacteria bacterium AqS2]